MNKPHPIEVELTQKLQYLTGQLNKENVWFSKFNYVVNRPQAYNKQERTRAELKRDECEKNIRELLDKIQTALTISTEQFNESTKEP